MRVIPAARDRPAVRTRRGRGLRVGAGLARGARALLRAHDRAGDADRRHPLPRRRAAVNVWIDITAPAHVLVFRPLIAILRERGDEVEITARDYAQTLQLLELHGIEADVLGRHGGRSRLGKARSLTLAPARAAPLGARARVRRRARARLARADDDRAPARDPERDHVRLRVRVAPAPARLPRGDAGRRPRGDPAGAARALRRAAAEAASSTRG